MKTSDFKLLSTLPKEFDYGLFDQLDNGILVVGKKNRTIIAFRLHGDRLISVLPELTFNEDTWKK